MAGRSRYTAWDRTEFEEGVSEEGISKKERLLTEEGVSKEERGVSEGVSEEGVSKKVRMLTKEGVSEEEVLKNERLLTKEEVSEEGVSKKERLLIEEGVSEEGVSKEERGVSEEEVLKNERLLTEEEVSKKERLLTEEGVSREGLVEPLPLDDYADFWEGCDDESWDSDYDDSYPDGTLKHERPDFDLIKSRYSRQFGLSKGFEIYDYPGPSVPLQLLPDFSSNIDLLMELAKRAVNEYNQKEHSAFKYKVLMIEKVNYGFTGYHHYFMTVKVLNVTLCTPIETFQIHGAECGWSDKKVIVSCWSKEEADAGSTIGSLGKLSVEGT